MRYPFAIGCAVATALLSLMSGGVEARVSFTVTVVDPLNEYTAYHSGITENVLAAGQAWSNHLVGNGVLDIKVQFDMALEYLAWGGSIGSRFMMNDGGYRVFEWRSAYEARTGIDSNGGEFDGFVTIGASYISTRWWFDPNPSTRTTVVPANRMDAQSIFMHEIGHMLAFGGWRDWTNGTLPADYLSPYDRHVSFDGQNLFFNGPSAVAEYGGPVPLTYGNYQHVGNDSPRPGQDVVSDLMNGVRNHYGRRLYISRLDLAIAQDCGVALTIPESYSDFDFDGNVSSADLDIWKRDYGRYGAGDADGNYVNDGTDFLVWQREVGNANMNSKARNVPEPNSHTVVPACLALIQLRRHWCVARRRTPLRKKR